MVGPFSKTDNQMFETLFCKHMNAESLPMYSAVGSGLCVLCRLAERIEAPKETASERMAIFLRRTVAFSALEEERSKSHLHSDV